MKKIKVENAIGMVLAHDVTRIDPGKRKGVGFKKGHVVRAADIPELLRLGKHHLYALEIPENHLHEDDAALRIARAVSGTSLDWTAPAEGKSNIICQFNGLLKIHTRSLLKINKLGNIILSTLKNNSPVRKGQIVAATRIIPLTIPGSKIERLEQVAHDNGPVIRILPFRRLKIGAVVTGTEIYEGLIADGFEKFVARRIRSYGSTVSKKILAPDDPQKIAEALHALKRLNCDLIVTTGGLSVDPDDVTRQGVKRAGAKIIVYGTPILPGAMFLYAFMGNTPVLGLPACVYYHPATVFDLIFPRVLAGDPITSHEIAEMGHGGLCLNCEKCRFPVCPFGK
jgi:hypothetical protein